MVMYSNDNGSIVFDQIFHSFFIKACFQKKNTLSECLKDLRTGTALQ